MSKECDRCEMFCEENDHLHEENARYKAKEFISFVEALGFNLESRLSSKYNSMNKKEKDHTRKVMEARDLCVAEYMNSLSEMMFQNILMDAGAVFTQKLLDTYRKVFFEDYSFKIEDGE